MVFSHPRGLWRAGVFDDVNPRHVLRFSYSKPCCNFKNIQTWSDIYLMKTERNLLGFFPHSFVFCCLILSLDCRVNFEECVFKIKLNV